MSQQLYVMTPGNAQPQLMTVDELAAKIKSGELQSSASCARLGESTWTPAKDLSELKSVLEGSVATPPPIAATRISSAPGPFAGLTPAPAPVAGSPFANDVPPTVATPSPIGGTPAPGPVGSSGGDRAKALVAEAKKLLENARHSQTAVVGAGAGAGLLLLLIIVLTWYRNSYSRGLVLEHVPEDCAVLGYVDIAGIATSDPVRSLRDKLTKNAKDTWDEQLEKEGKKQKERAEQAIAALQKQGLDDRSVREMAMCIPSVEDDDGKTKMASPEEKGLVLLGGTFRKGDVLKGIQESLEAALNKEDLCKVDDDDGLRLMTCTFEVPFIKKVKLYAALVEGRVLAISPDKKTIKGVKSAKDRAKTYSADKGEHVVFTTSEDAATYDGSYSTMKLKIGSNDTVLTVETHYDKKKGEAKIAKLKDGDAFEKRKREHFKTAAKECFEKSPIDMLADAVEGAEVEASDDSVKYTIKVSNKDLGKAIKALADADKDELNKIGNTSGCVTKIVDPYVE